MNVATLKENFLNSIAKWLEQRIDEMLKGNPAMTIPAVYMKRGCHNIICKYKEKIGDNIDKAALFLTDENGNINIDTVFADVIGMLNGMEETPFDMGIVKGLVGKGKVAMTLPENMLTNIVFGSKKTIVFGEEDFRGLKEMVEGF